MPPSIYKCRFLFLGSAADRIRISCKFLHIISLCLCCVFCSLNYELLNLFRFRYFKYLYGHTIWQVGIRDIIMSDYN